MIWALTIISTNTDVEINPRFVNGNFKVHSLICQVIYLYRATGGKMFCCPQHLKKWKVWRCNGWNIQLQKLFSKHWKYKFECIFHPIIFRLAVFFDEKGGKYTQICIFNALGVFSTFFFLEKQPIWNSCVGSQLYTLFYFIDHWEQHIFFSLWHYIQHVSQ